MAEAPPLPDLPELRMFERSATRGAVLRGLLRTAMLAFALYAAFVVAGTLFGGLLFAATHRGDRLDRVDVAFAVGHPGLYVRDNGSYGSETRHFGWTGTTQSTQTLDSQGTALVDYELVLGTFGGLKVKGHTTSRLDTVLMDGRASRQQAERFVKGLPTAALTTAVVELVDGKEPSDTSLSAQYQARFYDDPFAGARARYRKTDSGSEFSNTGRSQPVAWPRGARSIRFGSFQSWTKSLTSSDDDDLRALGLPDSAELRRLGEANRVHALLVTDLTTAQLASLLADPTVRTLTPVEVRFDILDKDQS